MTPQLSPCPACQRHIRINEQSCPFCAASIEVSGYTASPGYLREHAAAIFVGVTLAISGCNTRTEQAKPIPVDVKPLPAPIDQAEYVAPPKPNTAPTSVVVPTTGSSIIVPPVTPVYVTPPSTPSYRPKYGAPPPPFKPMKP